MGANADPGVWRAHAREGVAHLESLDLVLSRSQSEQSRSNGWFDLCYIYFQLFSCHLLHNV